MKDWDKELAKVDREIEAEQRERDQRRDIPGSPADDGPVVIEETPPSTRKATAAAVARLALAVALAVGIMFWPYDARCGAGLAAYLGAVAVVIVGGVWSSVWTWRHRTARAHTLSLLLILWGLILGATEILPRVGYARPTVQHPAIWSCE
ncbi:MAG: hypothetical protein ACRENI_00275 [Gemmatimonadaceae bacterium]